MSVPSEIPGFGSASLAPSQNTMFRPGADFGSEDYFVFSRCDGATPAKAIVLMVGLGVEKGCAILARLRRIGAILLPGERPHRPSSAPPSTPGAPRGSTPPQEAIPTAIALAGSSRTGDTAPPDLGALSPDEAAALGAALDLADRDRRRILEVVRMLTRASHYDLLGVAPGVDKKALKRAYFRVSKEFHPDRYYGRSLGPFGGWLTSIFERITQAYEVLSDERRRTTYEAQLRGESPRSRPPSGSHNRTEHAAELFERACAHEHRGELAEALRLFALTVRSDPQARYLRRAALCALAARELATAEQYASEGAKLRASDPAYARVLAEVLRASGKLEEAEATLLRALELKSENDVLARELRTELEAVRAARTRASR